MRVIRIAEVATESHARGIFLGTVESKRLVGESIGATDLKLDNHVPARCRKQIPLTFTRSGALCLIGQTYSCNAKRRGDRRARDVVRIAQRLC
jgi:hypothetical protein